MSAWLIATAPRSPRASAAAGSQGTSGSTPVPSQLAPVTASRTRASGINARAWPPDDTIVDLGPVAPNQHGASTGGAATSIVTAKRTGERVSGALLASILVEDAGGSYATCTARGVRFTVSQSR